jgi:tyrosinase
MDPDCYDPGASFPKHASVNMANTWTLRYVLQIALASTVICSPFASDQQLLQRQASVSVVTGIGWRDANGMHEIDPDYEHEVTPPGNVPVRREIRDLQKNHPDQWNLYLQGLEALHWNDQKDPLSLYGIASECILVPVAGGC